MQYKTIQEVQELQKNGDFSCGYPIYPFKKNIVIYSNCHGLVLSELLRHHPTVFKNYNVFLILGYLYDKKEEYGVTHIPYDIIQQFIVNADVFIYQTCYLDNDQLSSDILSSITKDSCQKIKLSNPQNSALWAGHFPEETRTYYNIHEEYIRTMQHFKSQDEQSDTPVYKFVVEQLKKKQLFLDRPHPTLRVFYEIIKHVWNILGAEELFFSEEMLESNKNPCQLPGGLEFLPLDRELGLSVQ